MINFRKTCALFTLGTMLSGGVTFAQDRRDDRRDDHQNSNRDEHRDNHGYVRHQDWKKGYHMRHEDWNRGERVDYRTYHLRRPPSGYEWRMVDGNYVLAAVATGIIASVIIAAATHN